MFYYETFDFLLISPIRYSAMTRSLEKLETDLRYKFQDLNMLERAVTHRSWAYEKVAQGSSKDVRDLQNETLEFVGDSVLGLAVAEQLYRRNPDLSEGDLTLMKHRLVSMQTLARVASGLELGKFLRIGRGEEKTDGRNKPALLADTFEAIIGAIFFDGGYISARTFVKKMLADEIRQVTPTSSLDYKTLFQETLQSEKRPAPTYNVIKTEGPPHNRIFSVEAVWDGGKTKGRGSSIKSAEMQAASLALIELEK